MLQITLKPSYDPKSKLSMTISSSTCNMGSLGFFFATGGKVGKNLCFTGRLATCRHFVINAKLYSFKGCFLMSLISSPHISCHEIFSYIIIRTVRIFFQHMRFVVIKGSCAHLERVPLLLNNIVLI